MGKSERAERALYGRDQGKQTPRKSLGLIPNGFGRFCVRRRLKLMMSPLASLWAPPVRERKREEGVLRKAGLLLGRCALRMRGDDAGPAWLELGWLG